MTAGVGPVSGTKFYIGPAGGIPTSPDLWIEVGDISNLGDVSLQFDQIAVESLGSGDTYQLKGQRKLPNINLVLNKNDSDVGQIALKAAAAATRGTLYPFRIQEADGNATTPGQATWQGECFGYGPSYGGVQALRTVKTSVSIRPSTLTITLGV
jgi:hypothetical protein